MGLLIPQTTHEKILALYQEVSQLKREPGEVQCSEDIVEECQDSGSTKGAPLAWVGFCPAGGA